MNIQHLQLFLRVAALQNISAAGRELGMSAAVASAQLHRLERDLGVRLIHRTTRQLSLTADGLAFLPHAEDVIASVEAAKAAVGSGERRPTGLLRVSAPASFGRMHLMPAMSDFMATYPELRVDLRLSDSLIDLVEGGFDVAVRNAELRDSTLVARRLATDRRVLCAAPNYIERYGEPDKPEALLQHQCITLSGLENWQFKSPKGTLSVKARGRFSADNGEAVRDACLAGLGITINSTWSAGHWLASGDLLEVLPDFPLLQESAIWAVYPSSRLLAPKVRAFIDFFSAYFGDTPYWDAEMSGQTGPVQGPA